MWIFFNSLIEIHLFTYHTADPLKACDSVALVYYRVVHHWARSNLWSQLSADLLCVLVTHLDVNLCVPALVCAWWGGGRNNDPPGHPDLYLFSSVDNSLIKPANVNCEFSELYFIWRYHLKLHNKLWGKATYVTVSGDKWITTWKLSGKRFLTLNSH